MTSIPSCSVCSHEYSVEDGPHTPKQLPCYHTFCRECIAGILAKPDKEQHKCPTCRGSMATIKSADDQPTNYALIDALNALAEQQKAAVCDLCKMKDASSTQAAVKRCMQCKSGRQWLCAHHASSHEEVLSEHTQVYEAEDLMGGSKKRKETEGGGAGGGAGGAGGGAGGGGAGGGAGGGGKRASIGAEATMKIADAESLSMLLSDLNTRIPQALKDVEAKQETLLQQVQAHRASLHAEVDVAMDGLCGRVRGACEERRKTLLSQQGELQKSLAVVQSIVQEMREGATKTKMHEDVMSRAQQIQAAAARVMDGEHSTIRVERQDEEMKRAREAIEQSAKVVVVMGRGEKEWQAKRFDRVVVFSAESVLLGSLDVDWDSNFVVADQKGHNVQIRSGADGRLLKTLGSEGAGRGQLNKPTGVAVARNGDIFVADQGNSRIVVFSAKSGEVVRMFGSHGVGAGQFKSPTGIAISSDGLVYVAEYGGDRVQVVTQTGEHVRMIGVGQMQKPVRVAVDDNNGLVYVTNVVQHRVEVFTKEGVHIRSIGAPGLMNRPFGVAVDGATGMIVVADHGNDRVCVFRPEDGGLVCSLTDDAVEYPVGVVFDRQGRLLVGGTKGAVRWA